MRTLGIAAALLLIPVAGAARPDAPIGGELWTFEPGDTVVTFDSTNFRVHYTEAGVHAVPLADGDGSTFPDHVEEVAALYEAALAFYTGTLGYPAPRDDGALASNNGGDARYDVYLVDFSFQSDGAYTSEGCDAGGKNCTGFVVHENDFAGYGYPSVTYANRLISSHELFHFVQARYDRALGVIPGEGSAVWATEAYDPTLSDLESFSQYFLDEPDRSLDVPPSGPVPTFAYGSGIWFEFLEQSQDIDVTRDLLDAVGATAAYDGEWLSLLDQVLLGRGTSFADALHTFARWNLATGPRADETSSYVGGSNLGVVRVDTVAPDYTDDALRVFHASAQYYGAAPDGRTEMTAQLYATDPIELDGVRLALAVLEPGQVTDLQEVTIGEPLTVAVNDSQTFVVLVSNGRTEGPSRRPGLCMGTPAEVEACLPAAPGDGDPGGCACSLAATPRAPLSRAVLPLSLLGLALVLRRRTRSALADRAARTRSAPAPPGPTRT